MKVTSTILIAVISGAAGAIAATLLAPDRGTVTRRNIARKGQEYKDYILDHFNDFADSVSHPFEDLEDQARRLSKNAVDKAKAFQAETF